MWYRGFKSDLKGQSALQCLWPGYDLDRGPHLLCHEECYEKGILTKGDTAGLDLRFGNVEGMMRMVEMIGKREGLGDILAEGICPAAEKFGKGAERFAIHVKGMPVPFHEPRGKARVGMGYAVSATGPDHMEYPHDPFWATEAGISPLRPLGIFEPVDVFDLGPQKIRIFVYLQQYWNLLNSLGVVCLLPSLLGLKPSTGLWIMSKR